MFNEIEAWEQQRLGKFTSSEIWKLMGNGRVKGNPFSQTAMTYIKTKAAELITGERTPDVNSNAIEYGRSMESEAFEVFNRLLPDLGAVHYGISVPKFYEYGDFAGGSPDGETGLDEAVIEIKCPYNSTNHIVHLLLNDGNDLKAECEDYYWQVQANMLFTGRHKAYFISYDPRVVKFEHRIKVLEVYADEHDKIKERIDLAAGVLSDILTTIKYF